MFEQSSLPLVDLAHDAQVLPPEVFAHKYGQAFFVHAGALDTGASPLLRTLTDCRQVTWVAGEGLHVFFVRPKATNVFPDFISIGRAPNNDVVISHPSVSKFHAYLRKQHDDLLLYDAASANGTFADHDRVSIKGRGAPTLLTSGVSLRFGMVDVMFLNADALLHLAQNLVHHAPEPAEDPLVANQH